MKVIAFNGSPRKNGNTHRLIQMVLEELEKEGIETELIWIGTKPLQGCIACGKCRKMQNNKCVFDNDPVNGWIQKMLEADAIILGSPVYCSDITGPLKTFIDRASFVTKMNNDDVLKGKLGAAVIAVRRCGAAHAFSTINYFFLISQMMVVGSSYWNMGIGLKPGDVENDEEGVRTMVNLGKNMAEELKKRS